MIILCGASASGKSEIAKVLIKNYNFKKLITYTTRDLRVGEVNHVDYHFISKEDFKSKIESNFFFEYIFYNGNYYGTAKEDITVDKVVILETNGFQKYNNAKLKDVYSFFLFSSKDKRKDRMIFRKDDPDQIEKRLILDETSFSLDKVEGINYIMNSNDLTVEELAKEIYEIYSINIKGEN